MSSRIFFAITATAETAAIIPINMKTFPIMWLSSEDHRPNGDGQNECRNCDCFCGEAEREGKHHAALRLWRCSKRVAHLQFDGS